MFEEVTGERLRTSLADAALVSIEGHEGQTDCVLRFDSSPVDGEGMNWVTVLRFAQVLDLRFADFELGLDLSNRQDFAYALIRLVDSDILKNFAHSKAL